MTENAHLYQAETRTETDPPRRGPSLRFPKRFLAVCGVLICTSLVVALGTRRYASVDIRSGDVRWSIEFFGIGLNSWIEGDGRENFKDVVLAERRWDYRSHKPLIPERGMYHGTFGKVSSDLSSFAITLEMSELDPPQKQAVYDTFVELCDRFEFLLIDHDESFDEDGHFSFRSMFENESFVIRPDGSWKRITASSRDDAASN